MKNVFFLLVVIFLFACKSEKKNPAQVEIVHDTSSVEKIELESSTPESIVPDYDTTKWIELISLDSTILFDLKYATTDNFVNEQLYDCGRCFLRREAADQLVKAQNMLKEKGFRFKMLDCYRPLPVQQQLWDKFQNASYVTPPGKGSMHNRGLAVDLTIVDRNGEELDMGTSFDFFGKEAHHTYTNFSDTILSNRNLLKNTMEKVGFKPIRTEWWHYSYTKKMYGLSEMVWNCPVE